MTGCAVVVAGALKALLLRSAANRLGRLVVITAATVGASVAGVVVVVVAAVVARGLAPKRRLVVGRRFAKPLLDRTGAPSLLFSETRFVCYKIEMKFCHSIQVGNGPQAGG